MANYNDDPKPLAGDSIQEHTNEVKKSEARKRFRSKTYTNAKQVESDLSYLNESVQEGTLSPNEFKGEIIKYGTGDQGTSFHISNENDKTQIIPVWHGDAYEHTQIAEDTRKVKEYYSRLEAQHYRPVIVEEGKTSLGESYYDRKMNLEKQFATEVNRLAYYGEKFGLGSNVNNILGKNPLAIDFSALGTPDDFVKAVQSSKNLTKLIDEYDALVKEGLTSGKEIPNDLKNTVEGIRFKGQLRDVFNSHDAKLELTGIQANKLRDFVNDPQAYWDAVSKNKEEFEKAVLDKYQEDVRNSGDYSPYMPYVMLQNAEKELAPEYMTYASQHGLDQLMKMQDAKQKYGSLAMANTSFIDGLIDSSMAALSFGVTDYMRGDQHITDMLFNPRTNSDFVKYAGTNEDVADYITSQYRQKMSPEYRNETDKFINETAEVTGSMLPFIITLNVAGVTQRMGSMLKNAETVGEKVGLWKLTKEVGNLFKSKATYELMRDASAVGIWNTGGRYTRQAMDEIELIPKLEGRMPTFLDYAKAFTWATTKAGLEGLSETAGAFMTPFVGRFIGTIGRSAFMRGINFTGRNFESTLTGKFLSYTLSDMGVEGLEERFNDLPEHLRFAFTGKGQNEEGQLVDMSAGEYLWNQAKQYGKEVLMFSLSSGFMAGAVRSKEFKDELQRNKYLKAANEQLMTKWNITKEQATFINEKILTDENIQNAKIRFNKLFNEANEQIAELKKEYEFTSNAPLGEQIQVIGKEEQATAELKDMGYSQEEIARVFSGDYTGVVMERLEREEKLDNAPATEEIVNPMMQFIERYSGETSLYLKGLQERADYISAPAALAGQEVDERVSEIIKLRTGIDVVANEETRMLAKIYEFASPVNKTVSVQAAQTAFEENPHLSEEVYNYLNTKFPHIAVKFQNDIIGSDGEKKAGAYSAMARLITISINDGNWTTMAHEHVHYFMDLIGNTKLKERGLEVFRSEGVSDSEANELLTEAIAADFMGRFEKSRTYSGKFVLFMRDLKNFIRQMFRPNMSSWDRDLVIGKLAKQFNDYRSVDDVTDLGTEEEQYQSLPKYVRYDGIITREQVRAKRNVLFVFGDNIQRKGLGGQAKEMRGEPNAVGIITKRFPDNEPGSFLTDESLEENKELIRKDIDKVIKTFKSGNYDRVVIPQIGVGLAKLPERAPKTWAFLNEELRRLRSEVEKTDTSTNLPFDNELSAESILKQRHEQKMREGSDVDPVDITEVYVPATSENAFINEDSKSDIAKEDVASRTLFSTWSGHLANIRSIMGYVPAEISNKSKLFKFIHQAKENVLPDAPMHSLIEDFEARFREIDAWIDYESDFAIPLTDGTIKVHLWDALNELYPTDSPRSYMEELFTQIYHMMPKRTLIVTGTEKGDVEVGEVFFDKDIPTTWDNATYSDGSKTKHIIDTRTIYDNLNDALAQKEIPVEVVRIGSYIDKTANIVTSRLSKTKVFNPVGQNGSMNTRNLVVNMMKRGFVHTLIAPGVAGTVALDISRLFDPKQIGEFLPVTYTDEVTGEQTKHTVWTLLHPLETLFQSEEAPGPQYTIDNPAPTSFLGRNPFVAEAVAKLYSVDFPNGQQKEEPDTDVMWNLLLKYDSMPAAERENNLSNLTEELLLAIYGFTVKDLYLANIFPEAADLAAYKRMGNISGEASRAFLTKDLFYKYGANNFPTSGPMYLKDGQLMVKYVIVSDADVSNEDRAAILGLDLKEIQAEARREARGVLRQEAMEAYSILLQNESVAQSNDAFTLQYINERIDDAAATILDEMLDFKIGDGACFVLPKVQEAIYDINGVPYSDRGISLKSKFFDIGTLHKKATFVAPGELDEFGTPTEDSSPIFKFMVRNGIGELNMSSAIKIKYDFSVTQGKSTVSLSDVMSGNFVEPETFVSERDILRDSYIQSKGRVKNNVKGFYPAFLTTSIVESLIQANPKANVQETINEFFVTNDIQRLKEGLKDLSYPPTFLDEIKEMADKLIESDAVEDVVNFIRSIPADKPHIAFQAFISDNYIKYGLTDKLVSVGSHEREGSFPVLMPDMGKYGTDWLKVIGSGFQKVIDNPKSDKNEVAVAKERLKELRGRFTPSGFLKKGNVIIDSYTAKKYKLKPGSQVIVACNPPAGMMDMRAMTVVGILPEHMGSNAMVTPISQFQILSGKDYDIDAVPLLPVKTSLERKIWDMIDKLDPDTYVETYRKKMSDRSKALYYSKRLNTEVKPSTAHLIGSGVFDENTDFVNPSLYKPSVLMKLSELATNMMIGRLYNIKITYDLMSSSGMNFVPVKEYSEVPERRDGESTKNAERYIDFLRNLKSNQITMVGGRSKDIPGAKISQIEYLEKISGKTLNYREAAYGIVPNPFGEGYLVVDIYDHAGASTNDMKADIERKLKNYNDFLSDNLDMVIELSVSFIERMKIAKMIGSEEVTDSYTGRVRNTNSYYWKALHSRLRVPKESAKYFKDYGSYAFTPDKGLGVNKEQRTEDLGVLDILTNIAVDWTDMSVTQFRYTEEKLLGKLFGAWTEEQLIATKKMIREQIQPVRLLAKDETSDQKFNAITYTQAAVRAAKIAERSPFRNSIPFQTAIELAKVNTLSSLPTRDDIVAMEEATVEYMQSVIASSYASENIQLREGTVVNPKTILNRAFSVEKGHVLYQLLPKLYPNRFTDAQIKTYIRAIVGPFVATGRALRAFNKLGTREWSEDVSKVGFLSEQRNESDPKKQANLERFDSLLVELGGMYAGRKFYQPYYLYSVFLANPNQFFKLISRLFQLSAFSPRRAGRVSFIGNQKAYEWVFSTKINTNANEFNEMDLSLSQVKGLKTGGTFNIPTVNFSRWTLENGKRKEERPFTTTDWRHMFATGTVEKSEKPVISTGAQASLRKAIEGDVKTFIKELFGAEGLLNIASDPRVQFEAQKLMMEFWNEATEEGIDIAVRTRRGQSMLEYEVPVVKQRMKLLTEDIKRTVEFFQETPKRTFSEKLTIIPTGLLRRALYLSMLGYGDTYMDISGVQSLLQRDINTDVRERVKAPFKVIEMLSSSKDPIAREIVDQYYDALEHSGKKVMGTKTEAENDQLPPPDTLYQSLPKADVSREQLREEVINNYMVDDYLLDLAKVNTTDEYIDQIIESYYNGYLTTRAFQIYEKGKTRDYRKFDMKESLDQAKKELKREKGVVPGPVAERVRQEFAQVLKSMKKIPNGIMNVAWKKVPFHQTIKVKANRTYIFAPNAVVARYTLFGKTYSIYAMDVATYFNEHLKADKPVVIGGSQIAHYIIAQTDHHFANQEALNSSITSTVTDTLNSSLESYGLPGALVFGSAVSAFKMAEGDYDRSSGKKRLKLTPFSIKKEGNRWIGQGFRVNDDGTITMGNAWDKETNDFKKTSIVEEGVGGRYTFVINRDNLEELANRILDENNMYDLRRPGIAVSDALFEYRKVKLAEIKQAILYRYVLDFWVPNRIQQHIDSINSVKQQAVKIYKTTSNVKSKASAHRTITLANQQIRRNAEMLEQIKGKRKSLAESGKFYLPHTYATSELQEAAMVRAWIETENINPEFNKLVYEEKVKRATRQVRAMINNAEQGTGGYWFTDTTNELSSFMERDDLDGYEMGPHVLDNYIGNLHNYMRQQSLELQGLMTEYYTRNESPWVQRELTHMNAHARGKDVYGFAPKGFGSLKKRQFVTYTRDYTFDDYKEMYFERMMQFPWFVDKLEMEKEHPSLLSLRTSSINMAKRAFSAYTTKYINKNGVAPYVSVSGEIVSVTRVGDVWNVITKDREGKTVGNRSTEIHSKSLRVFKGAHIQRKLGDMIYRLGLGTPAAARTAQFTTEKLTALAEMRLKLGGIAMLGLKPFYAMTNLFGGWAMNMSYFGSDYKKMVDRYQELLDTKSGKADAPEKYKEVFEMILDNHAAFMGNIDKVMGAWGGMAKILGSVEMADPQMSKWAHEFKSQYSKANDEWRNLSRSLQEEIGSLRLGSASDANMKKKSRLNSPAEALMHFYRTKGLQNFPLGLLSSMSIIPKGSTQLIDPGQVELFVRSMAALCSANMFVELDQKNRVDDVDDEGNPTKQAKVTKALLNHMMHSAMHAGVISNHFYYNPGIFLSKLGSAPVGRGFDMFAHYAMNTTIQMFTRLRNSFQQLEDMGYVQKGSIVRSIPVIAKNLKTKKFSYIASFYDNSLNKNVEIHLQSYNEARRFARTMFIAVASALAKKVVLALPRLIGFSYMGGVRQMFESLILGRFADSMQIPIVNFAFNWFTYAIGKFLKTFMGNPLGGPDDDDDEGLTKRFKGFMRAILGEDEETFVAQSRKYITRKAGGQDYAGVVDYETLHNTWLRGMVRNLGTSIYPAGVGERILIDIFTSCLISGGMPDNLLEMGIRTTSTFVPGTNLLLEGLRTADLLHITPVDIKVAEINALVQEYNDLIEKRTAIIKDIHNRYEGKKTDFELQAILKREGHLPVEEERRLKELEKKLEPYKKESLRNLEDEISRFGTNIVREKRVENLEKQFARKRYLEDFVAGKHINFRYENVETEAEKLLRYHLKTMIPGYTDDVEMQVLAEALIGSNAEGKIKKNIEQGAYFMQQEEEKAAKLDSINNIQQQLFNNLPLR